MKPLLFALVLLLPGAASAADLIQRLPQEFCLSARAAASPDAQMLEWTRCLSSEPLTDHQRAIAYTARAVLYLKKQDYQNALADLSSAISADPTMAAAYANRGSLYLVLKDPERAIADLTQALKLDPTITEIYIVRGTAYGSVNKFDEAIADFTTVINVEPRLKLQALLLRALAYAGKKDWTSGIADCSAALKLKDDTAIYTLRAAMYVNSRQYDKSVADFSTVITRTPNDALAYNNRATAYIGMKKYELAVADLSKAIALAPGQVLFYDNRGTGYDELGDCKSAVADFDKAISLGPDGIAYGSKAWVRATCPDGAYRNGAEAVDLAVKALQTGTGIAPGYAYISAMFHLALAAAYAETGQFDSAVLEQQLGIKLLPDDSPEDAEARANLALQNYKNKKPFRWPPEKLVSSLSLGVPAYGFAASGPPSASLARSAPLFPPQLQMPPAAPPQLLMLLPKELAP